MVTSGRAETLILGDGDAEMRCMRYAFSVVAYMDMVLRRMSGWRNADVDAEVQLRLIKRQNHERSC